MRIVAAEINVISAFIEVQIRVYMVQPIATGLTNPVMWKKLAEARIMLALSLEFLFVHGKANISGFLVGRSRP